MEKNTVNTSLIDSTAIKIIKNHYNFCYLHAMLEKIQHISVENLIVRVFISKWCAEFIYA